MNWNLVQYLPEVGACQDNFTNSVASYISAVYQKTVEEYGIFGGDSVIRRVVTSQSQCSKDPNDTSCKIEAYAQQLITGEMTQKLFL